MRTAISSVALVFALGSSTADACQMMTIPQLIDQLHPNPVERYVTRELVPIPFESIASKAELVIEGRVRPLKTYLSDDKCYLYTDFEVLAPIVIAGTVNPANTPGPHPLVVRQMGGTTIIDGVKVIVEDQQLPPFIGGQRVLLFLSRPAAGGPYEIVGEAFGAFAVEADGRVRPVLRVKGIYDDMQSLTRIEFLNRVKRATGR